MHHVNDRHKRFKQNIEPTVNEGVSQFAWAKRSRKKNAIISSNLLNEHQCEEPSTPDSCIPPHFKSNEYVFLYHQNEFI